MKDGAVDFRLDGRVALITGGSRGIGLAIARAFVAAGARLVISARKPEGLEAAAEELRALGGEVTPVACHTGDIEQVRALAARTVETYGTIDVLVNNAGANPYFGAMIDAEEWAWEKTVGVNLKGYFFLAQEAARVMMKQGKGSIVNVASIGGIKPGPMMGIYSITKAGVISLTQGLAKELAAHHIRVNAIAPGLINTKFSELLVNTKEIVEPALQGIPMGRYAEADEIAPAALYLASDAASYVTGTVLVVDGGAIA
ncbi:MAG: glucose 1-dehydrogenase [Proteobacteria bacterium]|nr:glucose 1-dehydrogenase [Pseudomonadota bacterium]